MKRTIHGSAMAAALGLALAARADDGVRADQPAEHPVEAKADTTGDAKAERAKVVAKLHQANLKELELGGLAQKHGGPAVQRYGQMLVDDHTKADVDVLNYAAKMGVSMAAPGAPVDGKATGGRYTNGQPPLVKDDPNLAEHVQMRDLESLRGQAFDRQFLTMMVADHKQDIADVREARAKLPEGDDLIAVLESALPTLQKHLDSAQVALGRMLPQARRPR